ncbi:hypothetical protein [Oceanobacillus senegalensis]|uniref:hypothetical protein n=1 Tax=Oceanobacillus senegalensis TaxID=1936063 RepID=UPI000A30BB79|nr:hypothetical protein [Oceanobacillus senegalensis]
MKKYSIYLLFGFMIISWGIGIYYFVTFYTPITVIPAFHNFYWTSTFTAMLGLTTIFTFISAIAIAILKFKKIYKWYIIHGVGIFIWGFTIFSQLKIAAFNLGICH